MHLLTIKVEGRIPVGSVIEHKVSSEERASEEVRSGLLATLDGFLAGELKPIAVIGGSGLDLERMETLEHQATRGPDRKMIHKHRPVPLGRQHIAAAKLIAKDESGEPMSSLDASAHEVFVHVVLNEGSQVDLPYCPDWKLGGENENSAPAESPETH